MAATTPFLNLYKPGGGSTGLIVPDEVVDIDRINTNMDSIDTWAQGIDTLVNVLRNSTGDVDIVLNGGWSDTIQNATVRVRNGWASMNGRLDAGTGATMTAFTLPAGARPTAQFVSSVMTSSNTLQTLIIQPGGDVIFYNLSLPASDYRLATVPPWPVA